MIPDDLKYTEQHEWTKVTGDTARVGITAFAQEQLGDIVFVTLPGADTEVAAGQQVGEIESTKSVSDLYAPVSGTIVAANGELDARPDLLNTDPYGDGWLIEIRLADPAEVDGLLDAAAYEKHTASS